MASRGRREYQTGDIRTFGGKSAEARAAVSEAALAVLAERFAVTLRETACDLSAQVTELDRPSFARTRSAEHADPSARYAGPPAA